MSSRSPRRITGQTRHCLRRHCLRRHSDSSLGWPHASVRRLWFAICSTYAGYDPALVRPEHCICPLQNPCRYHTLDRIFYATNYTVAALTFLWFLFGAAPMQACSLNSVAPSLCHPSIPARRAAVKRAPSTRSTAFACSVFIASDIHWVRQACSAVSQSTHSRCARACITLASAHSTLACTARLANAA